MARAVNRINGHDMTTLEKVFSRSGINMMTLIAIIFSAGIFYNQNSSYHDRTEERFVEFGKERDAQLDQMAKLSESINKTTIQLSSLTERMNAQTDVIKDIRELLRGKQIK